MPVKLKSKTGCLTCVARKKKCDEQRNPKCGHCSRLGLACIWRREKGDQAEGSESEPSTAVSTTNLKAKSLSPQFAISNGYPAFRSQFEKQLTAESSRILQPLICPTAGAGFEEVTLLGRFCTQSQLVRDAIVAFAAHSQGTRSDDSYKTCLTSYQSCITRLQKSRAYEEQNPAEKDYALTAILFLGLLESLKFGDPSHSIAHFQMCRKLLVSRLSDSAALEDSGLVKLYRIVAETIIYTSGVLSPYQVEITAQPIGTSFSCLFPGDDYHISSPFLGGFHEIYHVMLKLNRLVPRAQAGVRPPVDPTTSEACRSLWQELDRMDGKVERLYQTSSYNERVTRLYRAKHRIAILAMRIQLIKISRPSAIPADPDVKLNLATAVNIFSQQDIREPYNPALSWPLIILACATDTDKDFELISSKMYEIAEILDPADSRKLVSACHTLRRYREKGAGHRQFPIENSTQRLVSQLDYLFDPRRLEETV